MNRLRERTTVTLLIAIFMLSAFAIVIPVSAVPPTIDGVINSGEWDGAVSFDIGPCVGYVTNDEQYMYVAYDYGIKTEGEWANIITYREGLEPERTYISWVFVEETGLEPQLWIVQDTHTVTEDGERGEAIPDGLFTPFTPSSIDPLAVVDTVGVIGETNFVYAAVSATEMRIPLTKLGLTPGDSIKIMPGLHLLPNTIFVYPDSGTEDDDLTIIWSQDPDHYADYTLWEPDPVFYNLDITISGQGQVTYTADGHPVEKSGDGTTWTMTYEAGTFSDVFTAQTWDQYPDWEFVSWTVHFPWGDVVVTEPTGAVPMYGHTSVTATFEVRTKADILSDGGVPGKGIETAPGLDKEPPNDHFAKGRRKE